MAKVAASDALGQALGDRGVEAAAGRSRMKIASVLVPTNRDSALRVCGDPEIDRQDQHQVDQSPARSSPAVGRRGRRASRRTVRPDPGDVAKRPPGTPPRRHVQRVLGEGGDVVEDVGADGAAGEHHQRQDDDAAVVPDEPQPVRSGRRPARRRAGRRLRRMQRLGQVAPDPQPERQRDGAEQEGDPPAVGVERRRRPSGSKGRNRRSRPRPRRSLAGALPGDRHARGAAPARPPADRPWSAPPRRRARSPAPCAPAPPGSARRGRSRRRAGSAPARRSPRPSG